MVLTVETILKLTGCAPLGFPGALPALRGCSSYVLEAAQERNAPLIEVIPYDIEPRARWYCETLTALLAPYAAAFEKVRTTLIDRYKNDENKEALLLSDVQIILEQRVDLAIEKGLHFSDIKPDANAIPPSVLLVLADVTVDD